MKNASYFMDGRYNFMLGKMHSNLKYIFIATAILFAFSSSVVAAQKEPDKGVLYWVVKNDTYEMHVFSPENKLSMHMTTLTSEPEAIYFSSDWKELYYRQKNKLYRMDWKLGSNPEVYLIYPDKWCDNRANRQWRDKDSKNWYIAYSDSSLEPHPVIFKNDVPYLDYKKRHIKINNGYYEGNKNNKSLNIGPKYALEIVNIYQYDKNEGWKNVDYVPTVCNVARDPCLDVINKYRRVDTDTLSRGDLVNKMMINNTVLKQHGIIHKNDFDTITYNTSPYTGTNIKICSTKLGDSYGFKAPLSIINKNNGKEIVLIENDNDYYDTYLGIEQYKNYLLVVDSWVGKRGKVFDLLTGERILDSDVFAPHFWVNMPERIGPQ